MTSSHKTLGRTFRNLGRTIMDLYTAPVASPYPNLLSPLVLGGVELRNRSVMGSMHTGLEEAPGGYARMAAYYAERARGGAGLIVTGGLSPSPEGVQWDGMADFCTDAEAERHCAITQAVHAEGGLICLQLLHSGRYAHHARCIGPSSLRSPISPATPRPMTADDIERTLDDYARAALRAHHAGYDGVEIMGSEGYLIHQFLTLRANQRQDAWGGAYANRMRFGLETVRRTRARVPPDFVVMFRISLLDLVDGGGDWEEAVEFARALVEAGVTLLNSGIGWHEARIPTIATMVPRAIFTDLTRRLRQLVAVPVVASNRINDPAVAEAILARGDADLVSMARPFLADPFFMRKAAQGRADEINTCIACNQACLDEIFEQRLATCLVNPRAGRETEINVHLAQRRRKVAVIGAGPAGLSCALTAAERGHAVTLFDAAPEIGGQFNLARRIPGKEEFGQTLRYYARRLHLLGVTQRLGRVVGAEEIAAGSWDAVILATGVLPREVVLPGATPDRVMGYADVITGRRRPGTRVAIIGAGGIGFDVAEMLTHTAETESEDTAAESSESRFVAEWGIDLSNRTRGGLVPPTVTPPAREVWLLQRREEKPGLHLAKTTGWIRRTLLARRGVQMLGGVAYQRWSPDGLHITVNGQPRLLAVDSVVVCAGQEPLNSLNGELQARGITPRLVGGARVAGELDAMRAIREGLEAALGL